MDARLSDLFSFTGSIINDIVVNENEFPFLQNLNRTNQTNLL